MTNVTGVDAPKLGIGMMNPERIAGIVRGIAAACEVAGAHYGTDGSKLARAGIETVVCGPGDVAQAHTKDEYVEVEQLERAVRLYARVIEGWPRSAPAGGRA